MKRKATKPLTGMTLTQYGAHRGTDPREVRKAIKSGRITTLPDGSIDPAKADAAWLANTNPASAKKPGMKARETTLNGSSHGLKAVSADAIAVARDVLRRAGEKVGGGAMTFTEARTASEVVKAQMGELKLREKRGELVDKARFMALVFGLARQERDAWEAWPARVSALMASRLGIEAHKMETELAKAVKDQLAALGTIDIERALSGGKRGEAS